MNIMTIRIHNLENWYAGISYDGHNEGGGSPLRDENEVQNALMQIKAEFKDRYSFKVIDERKQEQQMSLVNF